MSDRIVRFCRVQIWEGPEDRLASAYANQINTGGVMRFADGVKYGAAPISWADVEVMHPKSISRLCEGLASVGAVEFEPVKGRAL
jgi:hypothetical protein